MVKKQRTTRSLQRKHIVLSRLSDTSDAFHTIAAESGLKTQKTNGNHGSRLKHHGQDAGDRVFFASVAARDNVLHFDTTASKHTSASATTVGCTQTDTDALSSKLTLSMEGIRDNDGHLPVPDNGFDSSSPLRGFVLCCTSVPPDQRLELAEKAIQMGAQHKFDLTSEVTHLIVGEHDTPKYRYVAKERSDIKVVLPSFVDAVSELWKVDQTVDISLLELQHKRPTFLNLSICLTGFETTEERTRLAKLIESNGGLYSGDLTKQITHLVALRPEGAKYKYAKQWNLQIVGIEWLHHSYERGMILDEGLYSLDLPPEERGQGAWKPCQNPKSPNGKRTRDTAFGAEDGKRKLRRTMSSKTTSQGIQIWGDIVGGSVSASTVPAPGEWETVPVRPVLQVSRSMVMQPHSTPFIADVQPILHMSKGGAMSGCRIYIHGFSPKHENVLRGALLSYDAEVASSLPQLTEGSEAQLLVIVPHTLPNPEIPRLPSSHSTIHIVTEFWVERCMEAKCFIHPESYDLGRPLSGYPLPGFEVLKVCSTGLTGVQILHICKIIGLLGANYDEEFSPNHSVLIYSPDRPGRVEKLQYAKTWKIPLVSTQWLFESIRLGTRQPFKAFSPKIGSKRSSGEDFDSVRPQSARLVAAEATRLRSKELPKPSGASGIDRSAFESDIMTPATNKTSSLTLSNQNQAVIVVQPLLEKSTNFTRKASASPEKPFISTVETIVVQKESSVDIESLLASAKTTVGHAEQQQEGPVKRKQNRILGRVASNVSTGSTRESRASSVDSTASAGQAVVWPAGSTSHLSRTNSGDPRSSRMAFVPEELETERPNDREPTQTQIGYDDRDSIAHRAQMLAKMNGETVVDRRGLEKVATIASLDSAADRPVGRRLRQR